MTLSAGRRIDIFLFKGVIWLIDVAKSLDEFIDKFGKPILQVDLTEYTVKQKWKNDIPDSVAVFKCDNKLSGIIVIGKVKHGAWIPNYGEIFLIKRLLSALRTNFVNGTFFSLFECH